MHNLGLFFFFLKQTFKKRYYYLIISKLCTFLKTKINYNDIY